MRCRLRTLLILLAVGPPVLAGAWFGCVAWADYRYQKLHHLEWGGTIVLDDLEPIEWDQLEEKVRETITP
jgi:hypothetical protein